MKLMLKFDISENTLMSAKTGLFLRNWQNLLNLAKISGFRMNFLTNECQIWTNNTKFDGRIENLEINLQQINRWYGTSIFKIVKNDQKYASKLNFHKNFIFSIRTFV